MWATLELAGLGGNLPGKQPFCDVWVTSVPMLWSALVGPPTSQRGTRVEVIIGLVCSPVARTRLPGGLRRRAQTEVLPRGSGRRPEPAPRRHRPFGEGLPLEQLGGGAHRAMSGSSTHDRPRVDLSSTPDRPKSDPRVTPNWPQFESWDAATSHAGCGDRCGERMRATAILPVATIF